MKGTVSRRDFLKVSIAALGVGFLAACKPAAQPTPTPAEVSTEPEPEEVDLEAISLEGKTGTLWGLQYDPHVIAYKHMADLFREKTGATMSVEPQEWPLETKVIAALAAGTQPDVACIMGKMCVPLYIQGALLPCNDQVYAFNGADPPEEYFFEDGIQAYTWEGELYGVPVEAGGLGNVVSVPVEEVEALGLADKYPPMDGRIWWDSYEEMWELAEALKIEDEAGRVERWGLSSKGWDASSYIGILRSLLDEQGTDWWDLDNEKFNVDTEEGVKAMELFAETPVKMGIETELDQSHVDAALAGKVALARGNGTPALSISEELGYHFELAGAPKVVGNKPPLSCSEAGWGFVAPVGSKNRDIAYEWLRFVCSLEGQTAYATAYGGVLGVAWRGLVGVTDHWTIPEDSAQRKAAPMYQGELCPLSRYYGEALGYYGEVDSIFGEVCSLVRLGDLTAAEACTEAQSRLEAQRKQWLEDIEG